MSEICLKLKVLAKIDFICFIDFIRGQSQKYWGLIFPAIQPRFMTHSKWPLSKSHIRLLGPGIARVTILMFIPMFLSTRNPIVPIKNVDVS